MNSEKSLFSDIADHTLQPIHSIFELEGNYFFEKKIFPQALTNIVISKQQKIPGHDPLKYRLKSDKNCVKNVFSTAFCQKASWRKFMMELLKLIEGFLYKHSEKRNLKNFLLLGIQVQRKMTNQRKMNPRNRMWPQTLNPKKKMIVRLLNPKKTVHQKICQIRI
jgi:hypothetical protein